MENFTAHAFDCKKQKKTKKTAEARNPTIHFFFFVFSSILIIAELGLLMEPSPKIAV